MIALLAATGATGWSFGASANRGVEGSTARVGAPQGAGPIQMVGSGPVGTDDLSRSVADLERLLGGQPEGLDANTVRILRKNLALIQAAVAESRDALATDPDNAYVRKHLEGAVERQRAFVQQASLLLAADD